MGWRPLSARSDQQKAVEYDALHDGVPPWMAVGAARWVVSTLESASYRTDLGDAIHLLEQVLRFPLDWRHRETSALNSLADEVANDGARALDVLDGVLMLSRQVLQAWDAPNRLDVVLTASGSAWRVATDASGRPCLQRRVDAAVEAAARAEMSEATRAGHHLSLSWDKVYGRSVDASGAYREAVRAVEAAARPVVTPSDAAATLGKMIRALQDKPEKWTAEVGSVGSVVEMLKALWTSQLDRHGTDDDTAPLSVTGAQAEAAVHLAMTLVHWFRGGLVRSV